VDNLVWIDCEMTGPDLGTDALIELAVLVTDPELNVLGDGVDIVIKPPARGGPQSLNFERIYGPPSEQGPSPGRMTSPAPSLSLTSSGVNCWHMGHREASVWTRPRSV